jgi:hypothetical protein
MSQPNSDLPGKERLALAIREQKRRRTRYQRSLNSDDFDPAVELAASRGWLVEESGVFRLKAAGEAVAKRSRTTRHLRRIDAL